MKDKPIPGFVAFSTVPAGDFNAAFPKLPASVRRKGRGTAGESAVVRACLELLAARGIFAWRTNNAGIYREGRFVFHGTPGVPDIIGILPGGRWLGVECKSLKGKQSEAQKEFQRRAVNSGGLYLLVRGAAELDAALRRAVK